MKALLDCDVLLDVATGRQPHVEDSSGVIDWCQAHPGSAFVAWHTLANVYYMLRKELGDADRRKFLHELLAFVEVVPAGTAEAKHALALPMGDFEDAMQCAAAVHAGVDFVVTRNIRDYTVSVVPAVRPADFLAQAPV